MTDQGDGIHEPDWYDALVSAADRAERERERAEAAERRVAEAREVLDKINALRPDQFKTDQHLPPAFREIDHRAAFMALAGLVNELEAVLVNE